MKDFVGFFVYPLIVALSTVWFTSWITDDLYKSSIGYNIAELNKMKENCEKDLPRSQVCVGEFKLVVKQNMQENNK